MLSMLGVDTTISLSELMAPSLDADPDALDLRVLAQTLRPQIAAEARGLVTAERHGGVVEIVGVDPHRAGLEPPRDRVRLLDVARPHPRGETVHDRVALADRVLDVVELDDREHRAEDLLLGHA